MSALRIPTATNLPPQYNFFFDFTPGLPPEMQRQIIRVTDSACICFDYDDTMAPPSKETLDALFPSSLAADETPAAFSD